jgi:hypothetical protein
MEQGLARASRAARASRTARLFGGMGHAVRFGMSHHRTRLSVPRCLLFLQAVSVALVGCGAASPSPPKPANTPSSGAGTTITTAGQTTEEITAEPQTYCDLVCERAMIVPRPADGPDYSARATDNANEVLAAMHDDLLACYQKRVAANPNAHGFITVDIVIDPEGHVRDVETTGGAILGERTMSCLVHRIRRGSFEPPHGGGTLRIHVPFSLRRVSPGDETL